MVKSILAILCDSEEEIMMVEVSLRLIGVKVIEYMIQEHHGKIVGFSYNFFNDICVRFRQNSMYHRAVKTDSIRVAPTLYDFIKEIQDGR